MLDVEELNVIDPVKKLEVSDGLVDLAALETVGKVDDTDETEAILLVEGAIEEAAVGLALFVATDASPP